MENRDSVNADSSQDKNNNDVCSTSGVGNDNVLPEIMFVNVSDYSNISDENDDDVINDVDSGGPSVTTQNRNVQK